MRFKNTFTSRDRSASLKPGAKDIARVVKDGKDVGKDAKDVGKDEKEKTCNRSNK